MSVNGIRLPLMVAAEEIGPSKYVISRRASFDESYLLEYYKEDGVAAWWFDPYKATQFSYEDAKRKQKYLATFSRSIYQISLQFAIKLYQKFMRGNSDKWLVVKLVDNCYYHFCEHNWLFSPANAVIYTKPAALAKVEHLSWGNQKFFVEPLVACVHRFELGLNKVPIGIAESVK